ncbi:MAG: nucleotidyltransferase domain-containing protein [Thermoplasmatota archaeon]
MHPARWLEAAFGSDSRVRILRFLVSRPPMAFTEREIAHAIRMSRNTVNRAINQLADAGLLRVETLGNAHAVRLAADGPVLAALRSVFAAEGTVWNAALASIRGALPKDAACYLFGSTAHGEANAASDVDLLIVTKDRETAADAAYAVEVKVARSVPARLHIIALDASEAARRAKRPGVVREAKEHGQRLTKWTLEDVASA